MLESVCEVGYGEADITPTPGIPLSGFISRENGPSTHVDDPLHVRVLVLRMGTELHFLVSLEVLGLSEALTRELLSRLDAALRPVLSRDRTVVVTTHTHSAPPTSPLEGEAEPDPDFCRKLTARTVDAVRTALGALQPAYLYIAALPAPGLTYNRRAILANGRVSMAAEPDGSILERGPVDNSLTVLLWRTLDGSNLVALAHFACHGTAVCTPGIGGDVPGAAARHISEVFDAPCIFVQGAAGDLNPLILVAGELEGLREWTERFRPYSDALPQQLRPASSTPVRSLTRVVSLEYQPLPSPLVIQKRITDFDKIAEVDLDSSEVQDTVLRLGNLMNFLPGARPDVAKAAYASRVLANAYRRILALAETGEPLSPIP